MNHSKIFLVTILSITTVLLASSAFAPLSSAQYQYQDQSQGQGQEGSGQEPPQEDDQGQGVQGQAQGGQESDDKGGQGFQRMGGQHQFQGMRTPVSGTYTNSNFGVQVTLPDGWSGFDMKQQSGNSRVMIAPGGMQTQGQHPPITIGISMMPSSSTQPQMMPRNMQGITCTNSTTTNTVNGLNFNVEIRDCSGTDQDGNPIEMKSKTETTRANSANIVLSFRANPASGYDTQVTNFDNMISTIQISTPTTSTQTSPTSTQISQASTSSSASTSIPTPVNPTPAVPTPIPTPPGEPAHIPNWVKGIFGMYAQGQLSDSDLVQALQFLIKQGIITIQP